jgi:hypothetical protein
VIILVERNTLNGFENTKTERYNIFPAHNYSKMMSGLFAEEKSNRSKPLMK